MIYTIKFTATALEDIEKLKLSGDKIALRKLDTIKTELEKHPRTGTGKPEPLRHYLQGFYSRRIS